VVAHALDGAEKVSVWYGAGIATHFLSGFGRFEAMASATV
jgi:hypothetical protein